MKQRDLSSCLANTADVVREAKQRAEDAEWEGNPNMHRLRREYEALAARYGEGETVTPIF